jgi:hypothetical protein
MEWKDAYEKLITNKLTGAQVKKIKKLFLDAKESGSLDVLLKDENARMCYQLLFNDTDTISKANKKDTFEKLTIQYPYLNNEYVSIDENGIVHIKILDTVNKRNVLRDVSISLDHFIKLIERERPSIADLNCPLCGEKLIGECIVSPTGLHFHKRCYDFIRAVVEDK